MYILNHSDSNIFISGKLVFFLRRIGEVELSINGFLEYVGALRKKYEWPKEFYGSLMAYQVHILDIPKTKESKMKLIYERASLNG